MTEPTPSILLVDDEEDICAVMADILADRGYQVDVAHEGKAALALVERQPYDVALLDYKMPGMDGLTLYREIKMLRSETVALLVTAYAGGSTVQ
jgi:CheY-like chemotaxis protein